MELKELMQLRLGVTAIIGGGGKTTFLRTAGEQLARHARVLLCTTTKIFPFPGIPTGHTLAELNHLSETYSLLCGGTFLSESGKLGPLNCSMADLTACFDYILVEADGSAGRPMKAHASHEPVIPTEANQVICIVGASGFGQTIQNAAHRPELYARLCGCSPEDAITPERAAEVLNREQLHHRVLVNQVEAVEQLAWVGRFSAQLDCPAAAGSLHKNEYFSC